MADITATGAAGAYQKIANMAGMQGGNQVAGSNFSSMLNQAIDKAAGSVQQAEIAGRKAMVDEVSLDQLAVAVADAEITLRTVVEIRDRIVAAYQDIIKMPI